MTPLRALVVGAGRIGSGYDLLREDGLPLTHAGAFAAHAGTVLVGGVDPDPAARAAFERRWSAPCFPDLQTALETTEPEIVSVATPVESHAEIVNRLSSTSIRGIWCEKPIATNAQSAVAMVANCAAAGVALQMNFVRRFDALHHRAATLVEQEMAESVHMDLRYSGTLSNYGSHAIDLVRWFAGDVAWVQAIPLDASEAVIVCGGENFTATLCRVINNDADIFDAQIFTHTSRITLTCMGEHLTYAEPEPSELFPPHHVLGTGTPLEVESGMSGAMLNGADALVRHVRDGAPLPVEGKDGLGALLVEEASIESAAHGGARVPVPGT